MSEAKEGRWGREGGGAGAAGGEGAAGAARGAARRRRGRGGGGAREHAELRILDVLDHLGVGHVFVDHDAAHQLRVLEAAAHLAVHLDQVEVDVLALDVGHREHGVDRNLRHRPVRAVHNLRRQRRHRHLDQRLLLLERVVERVRDLAEAFHRDFARLGGGRAASGASVARAPKFARRIARRIARGKFARAPCRSPRRRASGGCRGRGAARPSRAARPRARRRPSCRRRSRRPATSRARRGACRSGSPPSSARGWWRRRW